MHRFVAKFLLIFALVGNLAPLGRAVTAAPPHACCVRKAVHSCHDSLSSQKTRSIRDASCCADRCGRSVLIVRYAHPPRLGSTVFAQNIEIFFIDYNPIVPSTKNSGSRSTRAPPHFSIS
jgi:hypothetical protein